MSQVKLTLRPPPNVDFVSGYPGIPPATPARPQAAVNGALEVRVGSQGVKAKWVRIALRKVETVPPGGQANTFYDFVGNSPINLWQSGEDYSTLQTADFPFHIRIPESIPPSISLDKGAGIKYELVATVCTKGKRGLFRQTKSATVTTSSPITIDKHELHSTWPVYCQPERRDIGNEGVNLTVERSHTCFGPGDRVSVRATIRSSGPQPVVLRGFEFTLKESMIFRAGHLAGKKGVPQVRVAVVGDQKVPMNMALQGGNQHTAELSCVIPPTHGTPSLNAARHIDITYNLHVKALMGFGQPLVMNLPVVVSNWPRHMSVDAVKRIGPAPSLSLLPPTATHAIGSGAPQAHPNSYSGSGQPIASEPQGYLDSNASYTANAAKTYDTIPAAKPNGFDPGIDELGYNTRPKMGSPPAATMDHPGYGAQGAAGKSHKINTSYSGNQQASAAGGLPASLRPKSSSGPVSGTGVGKRPPSSLTGNSATNRFTITNISAEDQGQTAWPTAEEEKQRLYEHARADAERVQGNVTRDETSGLNNSSGAASSTGGRKRQSSVGNGGSSTNRFNLTNIAEDDRGKTPWPTAEEEKQRLYERARAEAERVQGSVVGNEVSAEPSTAKPPNRNADLAPAPTRSTSPGKSPWPTAEEEKARLFAEAQAVAKRTQEYGSSSYSPSPSRVISASGASGSGSGIQSIKSSSGVSAGAALYSHALSTMQKPLGDSMVASTSRVTSPGPSKSPAPQYPTAEEEKAALRRYHDAKLAVDRTQGTGLAYNDLTVAQTTPSSSSNPIPYNSLYPSSSTSTAQPPSPQAGPSELPPPFDISTAAPSQPSWMTEKEKLRRAYEAQDAAALARRSPPPAAAYSTPSPPPPSTTPPSYTGPITGAQILSEKEMLRRKYEAEERAANMSSSTPRQPLVRAASATPSMSSRAMPVPPTATAAISGTQKAAAQLMTKFDEGERLARGNTTGSQSKRVSSSSITTPGPPPPLKPRPPMDYIKETQDEDARVSRLTDTDLIPNTNGYDQHTFSPGTNGLEASPPPSAGAGSSNGIPNPDLPPPLPPKIRLD